MLEQSNIDISTWYNTMFFECRDLYKFSSEAVWHQILSYIWTVSYSKVPNEKCLGEINVFEYFMPQSTVNTQRLSGVGSQYGDLTWENQSVSKYLGFNFMGVAYHVGNIWIGPWANPPQCMDSTLYMLYFLKVRLAIRDLSAWHFS